MLLIKSTILGFKIGQDDHSCKGTIGTETWTCDKGDKYGRLNVSMEDGSGLFVKQKCAYIRKLDKQ